ncbi:MAG: hypothetical protein RL088_3693 [Verrucomicrobiota bacterium]|jgi:hypothetical protein
MRHEYYFSRESIAALAAIPKSQHSTLFMLREAANG